MTPQTPDPLPLTAVAQTFLDHVIETASVGPGAGCDGQCNEADALLATLDAARAATPVLTEALEQARLVAQWHGAIGSGPIEVLDAELGELQQLVHAALGGRS